MLHNCFQEQFVLVTSFSRDIKGLHDDISITNEKDMLFNHYNRDTQESVIGNSEVTLPQQPCMGNQRHTQIYHNSQAKNPTFKKTPPFVLPHLQPPPLKPLHSYSDLSSILRQLWKARVWLIYVEGIKKIKKCHLQKVGETLATLQRSLHAL